jgi:hypothetical protein
MEPKNEKTEVGTIAGIIIVIIVLVIGAIYFFRQRIEKQQQIEAMIQNEQKLANSTSTSDEATVDTTDLNRK